MVNDQGIRSGTTLRIKQYSKSRLKECRSLSGIIIGTWDTFEYGQQFEGGLNLERKYKIQCETDVSKVTFTSTLGKRHQVGKQTFSE